MADRLTRFDPYMVLKALDRYRVTYIVIGAFARVIHGTDELTRGIDIAPSTREENLRRLGLALEDLHARRYFSNTGQIESFWPLRGVLSPPPSSSRSSGEQSA